MDSGVFGAWARGVTLDIKTYIQFLKRYEQDLFCYATMDQIPGKQGVARIPSDVTQSAEVGYRNHQIMKDAGLKPIPIFHQGESYTFLERYLKDGDTYIGLATAKDMPGDLSDYHETWLDQMFSILTDDKGIPYVKTHGFGITKVQFMLRYPWYTCDSTTWSLAAGFGMIHVPAYTGGKPDYTRLPMRVIMSGREQISWSSARRQYDMLGPTERIQVLDYINNHCGLTLEQVTNVSGARRIANVKYFNAFCQDQARRPFTHRTPIEVGKMWVKGKAAPKMHSHMAVMFATMIANRGFSKILTDAGGVDRLVSYLDLLPLFEKNRDKLDRMMKSYVIHGTDKLDYKSKKVEAKNWKSEHYQSNRRMQLLARMERNVDEA